MSPAIQGKHGTRPALRSPLRGPGWGISLGIVVAVATLVAIVSTSSSGVRGVRGLRGIAPAERAALLSRTVEDLRQFCGAGRAPDLEDHCRELASFAAQFEECRGECDALVRQLIAPTPTR